VRLDRPTQRPAGLDEKALDRVQVGDQVLNRQLISLMQAQWRSRCGGARRKRKAP